GTGVQTCALPIDDHALGVARVNGCAEGSTSPELRRHTEPQSTLVPPLGASPANPFGATTRLADEARAVSDPLRRWGCCCSPEGRGGSHGDGFDAGDECRRRL